MCPLVWKFNKDNTWKLSNFKKMGLLPDLCNCTFSTIKEENCRNGIIKSCGISHWTCTMYDKIISSVTERKEEQNISQHKTCSTNNLFMTASVVKDVLIISTWWNCGKSAQHNWIIDCTYYRNTTASTCWKIIKMFYAYLMAPQEHTAQEKLKCIQEQMFFYININNVILYLT